MQYCRYVLERVEGLTDTMQYRIVRDVPVRKSMPDMLRDRGVPVDALAERYAGLDSSTRGCIYAYRAKVAEVMSDLAQARGMANLLEWPEESEGT